MVLEQICSDKSRLMSVNKDLRRQSVKTALLSFVSEHKPSDGAILHQLKDVKLICTVAIKCFSVFCSLKSLMIVVMIYFKL